MERAGGLAAVASRRILPPPAVAWRGARTACDGDGGCGGLADAGRAPARPEPASGGGGRSRPSLPAQVVSREDLGEVEHALGAAHHALFVGLQLDELGVGLELGLAALAARIRM